MIRLAVEDLAEALGEGYPDSDAYLAELDTLEAEQDFTERSAKLFALQERAPDASSTVELADSHDQAQARPDRDPDAQRVRNRGRSEEDRPCDREARGYDPAIRRSSI